MTTEEKQLLGDIGTVLLSLYVNYSVTSNRVVHAK